jgi:hypothetical protein
MRVRLAQTALLVVATMSLGCAWVRVRNDTPFVIEHADFEGYPAVSDLAPGETSWPQPRFLTWHVGMGHVVIDGRRFQTFGACRTGEVRRYGCWELRILEIDPRPTLSGNADGRVFAHVYDWDDDS